MAGPKDLASVALDDSPVQPWPSTWRQARSTLPSAASNADTFYENGCEETWRVQLERLPEGWRVRALDRTDPPRSSSLAPDD